MAVHVTDENFEAEVLNSELPVLLDFHAQWCGPCKMLAPILDELSTEYEGQWKIVKCDIDEAPAAAEKYGVQSIPTLKFIKNGEIVDEAIGFQSKDALKAKLV